MIEEKQIFNQYYTLQMILLNLWCIHLSFTTRLLGFLSALLLLCILDDVKFLAASVLKLHKNQNTQQYFRRYLGSWQILSKGSSLEAIFRPME